MDLQIENRKELPTPRVEIDLDKIEANARFMVKKMAALGLGVMGVTKVAAGEPRVAKALERGGIGTLADSRLENILRLKENGVKSRFALLRPPTFKQARKTVSFVEFSFNTDMEILKSLSAAAAAQNRVHKVVLMIEMGDLREGILAEETPEFMEAALKLEGLEIAGCSTNLACMSGVGPDQKIMGEFSGLVRFLMDRFNLRFEIVSGGSSANLPWLEGPHQLGEINNLRLGEALLLGREPLERKTLDGMHTDAFRLCAEVIESRVKKPIAVEKIFQNSAGETKATPSMEPKRRTILNMGYQDILAEGLTPMGGYAVLGASSDHMVIDGSGTDLKTGDEVTFNMSYSCLLAAMTSPYVAKIFVSND